MARAWALLALSLVTGCLFLLDIPPEGRRASGAPDAAPDVDDSCSLASIPPRPQETIVGGSRVYFALVTFGFAGAGRGFDLDGRCTRCFDAGSISCRSPKPTELYDAGYGPERCAEDGLHGIDNALGPELASYVATFQETGAINGLDRGEHGVILRLDGWTRGDNDPSLKLILAPSTQGIQVDDAGVRPTRKNDGTDRWTADIPQEGLGRIATEAYIIDRVLYARFRDLKFHVFKFNFDWSEAILRAEVKEAAPGVYKLERGVIAARTRMESVLTSLQSWVGPSFCDGTTGAVAQAYARGVFCPFADLMMPSTLEGREEVCNAASMTLEFEAAQADVVAELGSGVPQALLPCGEGFRLSCE